MKIAHVICILNKVDSVTLTENAPFSIIFSKVLKADLNFLEFFQSCVKKENDIMI